MLSDQIEFVFQNIFFVTDVDFVSWWDWLLFFKAKSSFFLFLFLNKLFKLPEVLLRKIAFDYRFRLWPLKCLIDFLAKVIKQMRLTMTIFVKTKQHITILWFHLFLRINHRWIGMNRCQWNALLFLHCCLYFSEVQLPKFLVVSLHRTH